MVFHEMLLNLKGKELLNSGCQEITGSLCFDLFALGELKCQRNE